MGKLKTAERAFIDKLFDEQFYQMSVYARTSLRNETIAQEAVQAAFETACVKINELMASPSPEGWLWNTLKNKIRNIHRHNKIMAKILVYIQADDEFNIENLPDERPPDTNVDILYADLRLYQEFDIIKKFAVEDKSLKEIAAEYGISVAACNQRLYRAKIKLRKLLLQSQIKK